MAGKPLVLGRVVGFRGPHGEVTVKVVSGDAARWAHIGQVVLQTAGRPSVDAPRRVESARAYRDRLVLKLAGIDDANAAEALRGSDVLAIAEDVPRLPQGVYWMDRLVGARVRDAALGDLGLVTDVVDTGGSSVLVVEDGNGIETLVPLVKEFVTKIDETSGLILVAIPEGLRGLNASGGGETA